MRVLATALAVICLLPGLLRPVHAQGIWSQEFGPHTVVLFKEVSGVIYYCTWVIEVARPPDDKRSIAAFDFGPKRTLTFRVRWRTELTENVSEQTLMHAIIDGADFPFLIFAIHRQKVLADIEGELFAGLGNKSLAELLERLTAAKSFRVYLPNGQFKEAEPIDFNRAAQVVTRCLGEATDLNKASTPRR